MVEPSTREQIEALLLRAQATTGSRLRSRWSATPPTWRSTAGCSTRSCVREPRSSASPAGRNRERADARARALLLAGAPRPRSATDDRIFTEPLADRELALLRLLPTHLTYGEIADQMCVSINTVKTYQKALFRKLNASKRSEAVAVARQAGLIDALA